MLLSLIIPRLESVKNMNFNVYITLVLEELQELWKGMEGLDVLKPIGSMQFIMKAILMWTIHNFSGYGVVYGCQHQGYKACPLCGLRIVSWWSKELSKTCFEGSHRWLRKNHLYRMHPNANISMVERSCEGGHQQK
jgi:hypothetical protein